MTDPKQAGSQPAQDDPLLILDDPEWDRPTDTSAIPDFNEVRRTRPEDPFPIRPFMKLESLVDIDTAPDCALIIGEGEAEEFTIGEDGNEMRNRLCLLQPGDIICPEYFAGLREGSKSPRTVAATTDGWAYVVRMQDLNDPDITPFLRRERLALVFRAFGRRNMADLNAVVGALAKEQYVEEALANADAQVRKAESELSIERRARQVLAAEIADLSAEMAKLKRENERLVEQAKQITKAAVSSALLKRHQELEQGNRKLTTENRELKRRAHEAEVTSKSAMDYVQALTADLLELERLRDLLDLQIADPNMFLSELQRMFLQLIYLEKHPQLQTHAVEGLGILSEISGKDALPPPTTK